MFEFLLILVIIYILRKLSKSTKLNRKLEARIQQLELRMTTVENKSADQTPQSDKPAISDTQSPSQETSTGKPISPSIEPKAVFPEPVSQLSTSKPIAPKVKKPAAKSELWSRIEKQLIENWTGILGAIIMVTGVAFFGIYAALKLSPFFRFLMIVGFSGVLLGLFYYLKARPGWIKLALWLRSSAGAIFLFACLGAGGFPGLQWIDNPLYALITLVFGVLVNLYLGYIGGKQVFASLHVLLSIIALAIAPQTNITFIIAALVSLSGIALTYREKWDYHLFQTISSFFFYHLYWFFSIRGDDGLTAGQNLLGIVVVVVVSLAAAFVHYREAYKTTKFEILPFGVHILNWLYFGLGLLIHTTGSRWKTIFIFLGAIAAFFLARRARKIGIRWLYYSDTLIAQAIAVIAFITLSTWEVDTLTIIGLIFLQTLIFPILMIKENEALLYRIGTHIMHLAGVFLIGAAFLLRDYDNTTLLYSQSIMIFVAIIAAMAYHIYTLKHVSPPFNLIDSVASPNDKASNFFSLIAALSGFLVMALFVNLLQTPWLVYGTVLIPIVLLYLREKYQSIGLGIAAIIFLPFTHLAFWQHLAGADEMSGVIKFAHGLPFLALSAAAIKWSFVEPLKNHIQWPGIYLFAGHVALMIYYIFNPISSLVPGVAWLVLSLVVLELSNVVSQQKETALLRSGSADRYLLHLGYLFIFAFLVRHVMVHLPTEAYLGIFKVRLLIECFAIATFAYWATAKPQATEKPYRSWTYLHSLFPELILIFTVFTISVEVSEFWHPIIWVAFAFGCLYIGLRYQPNLSRLRYYALLFNWAAAFQVAFLTSSYVTPSMSWFDQAWLSGVVAILLQFAFLYYYYHHGSLENISLPPALSFLKRWIAAIAPNRIHWLLYPIIICVAIFLFWSFDKSILTLLFVVECFLIFSLSIILREQHFRYVALIGLGLAIIRLIFFDLSQADTITRAFVFLGVGIIMLGINSIYNKYKERFENE